MAGDTTPSSTSSAPNLDGPAKLAWERSFGRGVFEVFKFWKWPENVKLFFNSYMQERRSLEEKTDLQRSVIADQTTTAVSAEVLSQDSSILSDNLVASIDQELNNNGKGCDKSDLTIVCHSYVEALKLTSKPASALRGMQKIIDSEEKQDAPVLEISEQKELASLGILTLVQIKDNYKDRFKKPEDLKLYIERLVSVQQYTPKLRRILLVAGHHFTRIFNKDNSDLLGIDKSKFESPSVLAQALFPKSFSSQKHNLTGLIEDLGANHPPSSLQVAQLVFWVDSQELTSLARKLSPL